MSRSRARAPDATASCAAPGPRSAARFPFRGMRTRRSSKAAAEGGEGEGGRRRRTPPRTWRRRRRRLPPVAGAKIERAARQRRPQGARREAGRARRRPRSESPMRRSVRGPMEGTGRRRDPLSTPLPAPEGTGGGGVAPRHLRRRRPRGPKRTARTTSGTEATGRETARPPPPRAPAPPAARTPTAAGASPRAGGCAATTAGGPRCVVPGCPSSAEQAADGRPGRCVAHAGGRRCEVAGCESSAVSGGVGGEALCGRHGGGRRCDVDGCPKAAVSGGAPGGGRFCRGHGGGLRCSVEGCGKAAQSGGRRTGAPPRCCGHGGGHRCAMSCCRGVEGLEPSHAPHAHPDDGRRMCAFAARYLVQCAPSDEERVALMRRFRFKKLLVMRGEHAFYHALTKEAPELRLTTRVLDASVRAAAGKIKGTGDGRPDAFQYIADGESEWAIHLEYDEGVKHEKGEGRLADVADAAGVDPSRVFVVRVQAHHDEPAKAVCARRTKGSHSYFELTRQGEEVVAETAEAVREILSWIRDGTADSRPDASRRWVINF
ncbi:hypothetical protein JKP88DRAFT_260791 [Tribonema minus]|uniref:Uncharacterized protein n=1 Tax=Tribonema minus TaxID=303371 RepID=A0A835ZKX4_9STRA|nr:hypothetical protein JKP88DRAFT_260791 [Tribonema minus]